MQDFLRSTDGEIRTLLVRELAKQDNQTAGSGRCGSAADVTNAACECAPVFGQRAGRMYSAINRVTWVELVGHRATRAEAAA